MAAGVFVLSVEALLVERLDGGGTDGTQIKPSTLISGREGGGCGGVGGCCEGVGW